MGRKRTEEEANVPLSAMMDVVFLLLIYFVFTQKPIIEDVHLGCDLPSPDSSSTPPEKPVPPFKIDVIEDKDPDVYRIDGRRMDFTRLATRLNQIPTDVTVIINCDPNAKHQKLIRLLDLLNEKEFTKLNLVDDMSVHFRR